jgi:hypothetical protein
VWNGWPFRKKVQTFPHPGSLEVAESWTLFEGAWDGQPAIVRTNAGLRAFAGHPAYACEVEVAIPIRSPSPLGLPDGQEEGELEIVGGALVDLLTFGEESLFAVVLTTGGRREYVFYTSDPDAVRDKLEAFRARVKSHALQVVLREDPTWTVFRRFR